MKLWFFALVFVVCSFARADVAVKAAPRPPAPAVGRLEMQKAKARQAPGQTRLRRAVFMLGYDVRFERNQEQQIKDRGMLNFAGGMEWSPWIGLLEYTTFKESTGEGSLSIDRKVDALFAWGYWQPREFNLLTPFLGGGLGAMKTTVNTSLSGDSSEDQSPWQTGLGVALGVRVWPRSHFWLSAEGRLYKGSQMDPDPMLGGLIRLGFAL